jgi:hypothetical protein
MRRLGSAQALGGGVETLEQDVRATFSAQVEVAIADLFGGGLWRLR